MNLKTALIVIAFLGLSIPRTAFAQPDIYVDKNAGGSNNGSSWADAYNELSTAISNASPLDELWVANGIYFAGAVAGDTFDLPAGLELYGGFQGVSHSGGGETSRDQRNPDPLTNGTVLSGDLADDDEPGVINGTNTSIILTIDTGSPAPLVDGFTIRGASVTAVLNTNSSPIFRNLHITENHSTSTGGAGMRNSTGLDPRLVRVNNCIFDHNSTSSSDGGAMLTTSSVSTNVSGCQFSANQAGGSGGAVEVRDSGSHVFEDCSFESNVCGGGNQGGALSCRSASSTVRNCLFVDNESGFQGGAIDASVGDFKLINSTFVGNLAEFGSGGGVAAVGGGTFLITNCRFFDNEAPIGWGGGMFIGKNLSGFVINNLMAGNSADRGGGLGSHDMLSAHVINATIADNSASGVGGGMYLNNQNEPDGVFHVTNTILWGNSATVSGSIAEEQFDIFAADPPIVTHCCIEDDDESDSSIPFNSGGITSNIDDDPDFSDPDGADDTPFTVDDDYRLTINSDCIDAGDNTPPPTDVYPVDTENVDQDGDTTEPTPDLDLSRRFAFGGEITTSTEDCDGVVDMGAYEFNVACLLGGFGDLNDDDETDGLDIQPFIECLLATSQACVCARGDFVLTATEGVTLEDVPAFVVCLLTGDCESESCPPAAGGPRSAPLDCNGNGVRDDVDIFLCNGDPDLCDCNGNGVPDACDIANEIAEDANENSIPDSCEADCNENGIVDDIDIANCTSDPACNDCNSNGVPDECELSTNDCDGDGTPDDCETMIDCNGNEIFDACEFDCSGDGIPDDCQLDGNDCNENLTPDDCEIAFPPPFNLPDCNDNGVPDSCDIADCQSDPACDDCNSNNIPDACDIANAISSDTNTNGVPDECEAQELTAGGSETMQSSSGGGGGGATGGSELTESEKWSAYLDWCFTTDFTGMTNAEKFSAMLTKRLDLGLPAGQQTP